MRPYEHVYIIASRRTVFGRVGGLHAHRRVEELAGRAIVAALEDAKLALPEVGALVLGNVRHGGNPARLAGLAAGLPGTAPALTIDRLCASGLEAVLHAIRLVALGEAEVAVAGGAESVSTAPWRLARPRSALQPPRFLDAQTGADATDLEASEVLAAAAGIDRQQQDDFAAAARRAAVSALQSGRLAREIAAFGAALTEQRDEVAPELGNDHINIGFSDQQGLLTNAGLSHPGDGAAASIIVGEATWKRLGRPPALRLLAVSAAAARPGAEASAPMEAVLGLRRRLAGSNQLPAVLQADQIELNETSAVQALALLGKLEIPAANFNPSGGALGCGRPGAAASAALVTRLFCGLLGDGRARPARCGLAVTGTSDGQGVCAAFETVAD